MKSIKKYMVIALCAVIVACSVGRPLTVKASSVNASRIVDVALTKTGIVANQSILKAVENKLVAVVRDTLKLYDTWLDENPSKEISADTFNEFVDGGGLSTFAYRAIEPYLNRKFIKALMSEYRDSLETAPVDIGEVITGEKSLLGVIISLPSELVNFIRSLFDEEAETYTDFYYIDTYSPEDVNPLWFSTSSNYQYFCHQLSNVSDFVFLRAYDSINVVPRFDNTTGIIDQWWIHKFDNNVMFVDNPYSKYRYRVDLYKEDWTIGYDVYMTEKEPLSENELMQTTFDDCARLVPNWQTMADYVGIYVAGSTLCQMGIWTNDGRPIKVYKSVTAMKEATLGNDRYYVTNNAYNYETNDNSVSIGGDWLESTNYSYSHDVVQNNINNSETVTNETINNIVNNNVTNITNNYASTTTPDNGNNGGNGGGGLGSILDGLGSIISALAEIVGFLLGVIGDVIGLIGQLFNVVFEGLKTIGTLVGNFPKLLGDLFVFIPQELIDFLVLSIEASVGIAIWRKFSKK